jgi:hypothetical protein
MCQKKSINYGKIVLKSNLQANLRKLKSLVKIKL